MQQTYDFSDPSQQVNRLLDEYNIPEMIMANWNTISNYFSHLKSIPSEQIQKIILETCNTHLDQILSQEDVNTIKRIATYSGISLSELTNAIAIVIRNRYFAEHEIPT